MSQDSDNKWAMPEPQFRNSTGELVKPLAREEFDPEPDTLQPDLSAEQEEIPNPTPEANSEVDPEADTLTPDPPAPEDPLAKLYAPPENATPSGVSQPVTDSNHPAVEIEPQPYVSEQFTTDDVGVRTGTTAPKGFSRPLMILLGLVALFAVAAGFVALVYFLFFADRTTSSGF